MLRYDDETEEWVKLETVDSPAGEICALTHEFSVYAVADEVDHLRHLSGRRIHDFSVWEGDYSLTASELLSALPDAGLLWVWNDEEWIGYATMDGVPLPGAQDIPITAGDTLWLGSGVSGGDG